MKKRCALLCLLVILILAFAPAAMGTMVRELMLPLSFGTVTGTYTGEMKDDLPHGYGIFIAEGWYYAGMFEAGHFCGEGLLVREDGGEESGVYDNDVLNGYGTISKDGKVLQEGIFLAGVYMDTTTGPEEPAANMTTAVAAASPSYANSAQPEPEGLSGGVIFFLILLMVGGTAAAVFGLTRMSRLLAREEAAASRQAAAAPKPQPRKINLNTASEQELIALPGVSEITAKRAIVTRAQRAFASVQDFNQRLGLTPHCAAQIEKQAFAEPAAPQKIELNTATEQALSSLPGVSAAMAERAIRMRRQRAFVSAQDFSQRLGILPYYTQRIEKLIYFKPSAPQQTVPLPLQDFPTRVPHVSPQGPPTQPSAPRPAQQMINLNTATEQELDTLPGIGVVLAKRAIEMRAQSPFASVQDFNQRLGLVLVPHFAVQIEKLAFAEPAAPQPQPQSPWASTGRVVDI